MNALATACKQHDEQVGIGWDSWRGVRSFLGLGVNAGLTTAK